MKSTWYPRPKTIIPDSRFCDSLPQSIALFASETFSHWDRYPTYYFTVDLWLSLTKIFSFLIVGFVRQQPKTTGICSFLMESWQLAVQSNSITRYFILGPLLEIVPDDMKNCESDLHYLETLRSLSMHFTFWQLISSFSQKGISTSPNSSIRRIVQFVVMANELSPELSGIKFFSNRQCQIGCWRNTRKFISNLLLF